MLQEIHKQLQKSHGQQAINYPLHTKLEHALICCFKIVQQFSYAQKIRNVMEQQEVATSSSLKTLHPFIDKEGFSEWEEDYSNPRFLIKHCNR